MNNTCLQSNNADRTLESPRTIQTRSVYGDSEKKEKPALKQMLTRPKENSN